MKRLLFAILAVVMTAAVASAQNYMVVDTEDVLVICPKDDKKFK